MVGAGTIAIVLGVALHLPLAVAAAAGVVFLARRSVALHMRHERRRHERAGARVEAIFPSPQASVQAAELNTEGLPEHVVLAARVPGSEAPGKPRPPARFPS